MNLVDLAKIPERTAIAYLNSSLMRSHASMMRQIFQYDYTHSVTQDKIHPTDWTMKAIDDIFANIDKKSDMLVAISTNPDGELMIHEFNLHGSKELYDLQENIVHEVDYPLDSDVKVRIANTFMPHCKSCIIAKHFDRMSVLTIFSLKRFLYTTGIRLSEEDYLLNNSDPFMEMQSNGYDCRFQTGFIWGNDTILKYYGRDPFDSSIVTYSSSDRDKVMYVAAAHKALVHAGINCYTPLLQIKEKEG